MSFPASDRESATMSANTSRREKGVIICPWPFTVPFRLSGLSSSRSAIDRSRPRMSKVQVSFGLSESTPAMLSPWAPPSSEKPLMTICLSAMNTDEGLMVQVSPPMLKKDGLRKSCILSELCALSGKKSRALNLPASSESGLLQKLMSASTASAAQSAFRVASAMLSLPDWIIWVEMSAYELSRPKSRTARRSCTYTPAVASSGELILAQRVLSPGEERVIAVPRSTCIPGAR